MPVLTAEADAIDDRESVTATQRTGDIPTHQGHRERLRERFLRSGTDGLLDYELIELLLTYVFPRQDTKPIAKALLGRYHTLHALLHAPTREIEEFGGMGKRSALLFSLVREFAAASMREKCKERSVITHRSDIEEYLRFYFGSRRDEYVAAVYLDNSNGVIATDILAEGTVNQCALYPRQIIEKALLRGAASIILAHNHPGGNTTPSSADWNITERLIAIGKLLDMPLLDHIIITGDSVVSLRSLDRWVK